MAIFLKRTNAGLIFLWIVLVLNHVYAQEGQISIDRIAQMPNSPEPYLMRDWKKVAREYDALVYNQNVTGQYLPLIFLKGTGTNYPENESFGLDTYVGTFANQSGEAINVLPSLIGATLVGIDKSNQEGKNWVLMSQDFFNKRPEENVYLNHPTTSSGRDWWYDVMPNIYFYQLNYLYPNMGDADVQFISVADQWLRAVRAMGGADTPWETPYMDYRAWNLSLMTPLDEGVKQPEAAGGIAWLLYHAYQQTGDGEYLKGAEWCMEFLNELTSNPSYELQLPYGIYTAARMNAEIGTHYNIEKMMNWAFDRGPLRGWGAIAGQWNGMDVSGLIGEANDQGNDYAFLMNGMQHAAALVPMVRYDKRFARAIGKWVLNLANATRLFYSGFLPPEQQDASDWSLVHDPEGYIGYEGLREKLNNQLGPFSTGDPVINGWGNTNLALYGSSSVGIFGGIIDTTNLQKILKLDLLKTDFYREEAYPTYLFFNPYFSSQIIELDVGPDPVDVYDIITETFVLQDVQGKVTFSIPADQARVLVQAPAGGSVNYVFNRMLVNDVVVDYSQPSQSFNYPPRIKSLAAAEMLIEVKASTSLFVTAVDRENEALTYSWKVNDEPLSGSDAVVSWSAPEIPGEYKISVIVMDEQQQQTSDSLILTVVEDINTPPEIIDLSLVDPEVEPDQSVELVCKAQDIDDESLIYNWSSDAGTLMGEGSSVIWKSPSTPGVYEIMVVVEDGKGGADEQRLNVQVKDFSQAQEGNLIASYPFSGNADDWSGNQFHGQVVGAMLAKDLHGVSDNAYWFDGSNDHIRVTNNNKLNFTKAITVSFEIQPGKLPSDRESFVISHGSWQNRWKVSIIPGSRLRWSLNTSTGIKDVDSRLTLEEGEPYQVAAIYDGSFMLLYVNGKLDGYSPFTGAINPSSVDLLMARMLPDDNNAFNYHGTLDNVRIFDYAVSPAIIPDLFKDQTVTGIISLSSSELRVYPNPTHRYVTVEFEDDPIWNAIILYNAYGQKMEPAVISDRYKTSGRYYRVDLGEYPGGIYFLYFKAAKRNKVVRIAISR